MTPNLSLLQADSAAKEPPKHFYGGQAVIEGVMMRGTRHFAVACRRANGEIVVTCEPVPPILRPNWQKWPLLRGVFSLVDAMMLGTKALFWSAKIAEQDIPKDEKNAEAVGAALPGNVPGPSPLSGADAGKATNSATDEAIKRAALVGLLFFVGLFKLAPHLLVEWLKHIGIQKVYWLGLADFSVRLTIFVVYVLAISRMRYIYRVFQYHGAEHKAINALEAGGALTVATAGDASRLHPRCGTAFVVVVLFLSVLFVAPFYSQPLWARLLIQIGLIVPVAGVSFELLRLAGKYRNNPLAALLSMPGMWAQLLTTREPDESQLEVSLASLKAVMEAEGKETLPPKSPPPVA